MDEQQNHQNLNSDLESIYSFDSVATNERLLDRLDFDTASVRSNKSTNYRDRSLDSGNGQLNPKSSRYHDVNYYNNYLNQNRHNDLSSIVKLRNQDRHNARSQNSSGRDVTGNNLKFSSSRYNTASPNINTRDTNSYAKLKTIPKHSSFFANNATSEDISSEIVSLNYKSVEDLPASSSSSAIKSSNKDMFNHYTDDLAKTTSKLSLYPSNQTRPPPHLFQTQQRSVSGSSMTSNSSIPSNNSIDHPDIDFGTKPSHSASIPSQPLRMFTSRDEIFMLSRGNSHDNIKNEEQSSQISQPQIQTQLTQSTFHKSNSRSADLTPKEKSIIALELRSKGNHRESSYQLQILANDPFNYPKAMYHYAIALKYGYGLKQNYASSVKWICKCILVSTVDGKGNHETEQQLKSNLIVKLNKITPTEIVDLIIKDLRNTFETDPYGNGSNPESLYLTFKKFDKNQINRIISNNKSKSDVLALSYYELGKYLLSNNIQMSKDDEMNGIICLSKSASLGNVDAMEQLGEIWTTKTKNHKKDLFKAAAWLRSSELFGVKSIGNSWIYKDKYLNCS
ncbi:uncharacterized protein KGF55_002686 [Candida pseudojiufengensis]|uniref:uncharacterized protein n=1 Tax=Candida pseudojiufengensis TaxID=497109 RepID=UPI0022245AAF|nr:uncharacterized protein KGF55_002686 [Candida pseudojiufengensis]KAI5963806.1 hypothetical protein KGF55_002686 [Candida pseudojiufengensis]